MFSRKDRKMPDFQISLAAARINAVLTQEEVARALRVKTETVVNWETGDAEPEISQGRELSTLFKIPLEYIFFA